MVLRARKQKKSAETILVEKGKKRKATQAAKRSLHQLRKRRQIGPECREPPPMDTICNGDLEGHRVAGRPLLQTKAMRAHSFQMRNLRTFL